MKRLALVKDLVEGGTPLGELAGLSLDDLEGLFHRSHRADEHTVAEGTPQVNAPPPVLERAATLLLATTTTPALQRLVIAFA